MLLQLSAELPRREEKAQPEVLGTLLVTALVLQCCSCLMFVLCLATVTLLLSSSHSEETLPGTCSLRPGKPGLRRNFHGKHCRAGGALLLAAVLWAVQCSWVWWDRGSTGAAVQTGVNLKSEEMCSRWALFSFVTLGVV